MPSGWFPSRTVISFMARLKAAVGRFRITHFPDHLSASPQRASGSPTRRNSLLSITQRPSPLFRMPLRNALCVPLPASRKHPSRTIASKFSINIIQALRNMAFVSKIEPGGPCTRQIPYTKPGVFESSFHRSRQIEFIRLGNAGHQLVDSDIADL